MTDFGKDIVKIGYIDDASINVDILSAYSYPEDSPVGKWGKLKVAKNAKGVRCLCSETGEPVQLKGFSTHGLQWAGVANVTECNIKALKEEWGCSVFRLALYVDYEGGYAYNPTFRQTMLENVVRWTAECGMYLVIDWHVLAPASPQAPEYRCHPMNGMDLAGDFFTYCARRFQNQKHILYELCNEPNIDNGEKIPWVGVIKDYCEDMLRIVRTYDKDVVALCGTPSWSQDTQDVIGHEVTDENGVPYENVMYTFHVYAASHNDGRDIDTPTTFRGINFMKRFQKGDPEKGIPAILNTLPVFVTEWGTTDAGGWTNFRPDLSDMWLEIFDGDNDGGQLVSWCNWSFSAEGGVCGALKWNTGKISPLDPEILTESGKYVYDHLKNETNKIK